MQACACRMWHSHIFRFSPKNITHLGRSQMMSGDATEGIKQTDELQLPEEPTTCCMSGCANCVWIQYAEELSKLIGSEGPQKAQEIIMARVTDVNIQAYLLTELTILRNKLS